MESDLLFQFLPISADFLRHYLDRKFHLAYFTGHSLICRISKLSIIFLFEYCFYPLSKAILMNVHHASYAFARLDETTFGLIRVLKTYSALKDLLNYFNTTLGLFLAAFISYNYCT